MTHSPSPPDFGVDEDLNRDAVAEAGCISGLASDPTSVCTGKEWGVGRHRGHRIGGRLSGAWRVEVEVHDGEGLDEL